MSNSKENLKTGVSASAGAALGSAAGILASMYGTEAHAANAQPIEVASENVEIPTEEVQAEVVEQSVGDDTQVEVVSASCQQEAQAYNAGYGISNQTEPQPEVQVLGYDTIPGPNGTPVQAALVSIDGQQMVVADLDNDGIADIVCADLNGNGQLDNGEVEDITGYQMQMEQFQAAVEPDNNFYAQTAYDPDYTNDANIDTYMV